VANVRFRLVRDAGVVCAVSVLLLALIELGLRLGSEETGEVYQAHPVYGMALRPHTRAEYERPAWHGGETIWWETNSLGLRGPEPASNPATRIVVYGDSNVHAMFTDRPDTFTEKLSESLSRGRSQSVEVINAGTVGFGPDQNLLRFQLEAERDHPDLVIFHVFADNDYGDLIRNRLFELEESQLVRTSHPLVEDEYLASEPTLLLVRVAFRWARTLRQALLGSGDQPLIPRDQRGMSEDERSDAVVANLLERRRQEFERYAAGEPRSFSYLADEYDVDVALEPDGLAAVTKAALMEQVLVAAATFARERQIAFMVLIQPSVSDLTSLRPIHLEHLGRDPDYDARRLTSLVDEICARHGIPRLNLYDAFEHNAPEQLFFPYDVHWNDRGQELAAIETAEFVRETFLSGPFVTGGSESIPGQ
jgi:hypothetical protein